MEVKLKRNKWLTILVILLGTAIAFLNETALTTALATIMRDLNLTAATGQWLTTIFMLVAGIMIPMSAFLIERFSTRTLFFIAMGLFTIGTLIGAFAGNFQVLLFARILQAMGGGITLPLIQVVVLSLFKPEERGGAMGIIGIIISFAPAIGPTLSGWIVTHFQWDYIFFLSLPVAILDIVLGIFLLENVKGAKKTKVDILSAITSALGFGGLLYGFSNIGSYSFTNVQVYAPLVVGVIALIYFSIRQLKVLDKPFLDLRVFKDKTFTFGTLVIVIVFAAFIGAGVILPLYIQDERGYSAFQSGLILMPGAILNGIMNPITGKIFDKFGARYLALVGLSCITIGTFGLTTLTSSTSMLFVMGMYSLMLFGLGMVLMPVTTMALNDLDRSLYAHGTAAINTLRQIMASIGTAAFVAIMTYVAEHSSLKNPIQAAIHGVNIAFLVAAALSLLSLIVAFFVIKNKKQIKKKEVVKNIKEDKNLEVVEELVDEVKEEIDFNRIRKQLSDETLISFDNSEVNGNLDALEQKDNTIQALNKEIIATLEDNTTIKEEIGKDLQEHLALLSDEIAEKIKDEIKLDRIKNQEKVQINQKILVQPNNSVTNDKLNNSIENLIKEERKTKNLLLLGGAAIGAVIIYLLHKKRD